MDAVHLGLDNNKDVVVYQYEPSLQGTIIQTQRAFFDPVTGVAVYGGQSEVQVRSLIESFGSVADFQDTNFLYPLERPNDLYWKRRMYSGGEVELGFATDYEDYFPQGDQLIVNPGWDSAVNLRIDQPLFQGRGKDVTTVPIRVAQAKQCESQFIFMREVRQLSRDIELGYWEFAGAERAILVMQQLVQDAEALVKEETSRLELGQSALPNVLMARSLLEEFRATAEKQQQTRDIAESKLRQIIGMQADESLGQCVAGLPPIGISPSVDGYLTAEPPAMPHEMLLQMALQRPEILAQNASIQAARADLCRARNMLEPNVKARVNYSVNGLEESLGDSISTIARHEYNIWSVGVLYERPFGQRAEHADVSRANLTLSRETAKRDKVEHDILHAVKRSEDKLQSAQELLIIAERRVGIAEEQVKAYSSLYKESRADLFLELDSQRTLAAAKVALAEAWRDRQMAIADRNYEANLDSGFYQFEAN
jgi:outer membrane protein TolC